MSSSNKDILHHKHIDGYKWIGLFTIDKCMKTVFLSCLFFHQFKFCVSCSGIVLVTLTKSMIIYLFFRQSYRYNLNWSLDLLLDAQFTWKVSGVTYSFRQRIGCEQILKDIIRQRFYFAPCLHLKFTSKF